MFSPPPGSKIKVVYEQGYPVVVIPRPSGGVMRFFMGAFLLFWLGGWFMGWRSAAAQLIGGAGPAEIFLLFWLAGWTVGGLFAAVFLWRILRPPLPEVFSFSSSELVYDSGFSSFCPSRDCSVQSQQEAWKKAFPKRVKVAVNHMDLKTLKLREFESGNRLTVDVKGERLDLAGEAGEVEREWLYQAIKSYYNL